MSSPGHDEPKKASPRRPSPILGATSIVAQRAAAIEARISQLEALEAVAAKPVNRGYGKRRQTVGSHEGAESASPATPATPNFRQSGATTLDPRPLSRNSIRGSPSTATPLPPLPKTPPNLRGNQDPSSELKSTPFTQWEKDKPQLDRAGGPQPNSNHPTTSASLLSRLASLSLPSRSNPNSSKQLFQLQATPLNNTGSPFPAPSKPPTAPPDSANAVHPAKLAPPPTQVATGPSETRQRQKMAEGTGPEGGVVMPRLEDLLRHPEDLEKIPALKAEYSRKKAAVDSQLREGLRVQLETVQRGIGHLTDGQRHVMKTRDELQNIDKLCAESQTTVGDFSQIDKLARIQRNFEAVIMMKKSLEVFHTDLADVERLLREDDEDLENQPNLLNAHMGLTRLRDLRDEAMEQIEKSQDKDSESTLTEWFQGLDSVIDWFDDHLGTVCMNLIPLVQSDNRSMVVRLAVVIHTEEKNDAKVRAIQEAQKDHKYLASRFKSMNIGPKTVRGYKENLLKSIELYAQTQFESTKETFLDDPDKLEKSLKWFFNDLFTVKEGMQSLMPKKWKIYKTYTDIYHKLMHDWLIEFVDDAQLPAANMLAIIHWVEKYYKKMAKLGWNQTDLVPNVLDDREGELVHDWRNLIVKALDEWMERMFNVDKKAFLDRDGDSLDTNHDGFFRTKTIGDMWRMIHEQLIAAGASQRTDVAEGVVDAMFRALKTRQSVWQTILDEECAKYKNPSAERSEGLQQLQDWLLAIANDQIACVDDNDASGSLGYLTRFRRDLEPLVTEKYMTSRASAEMDSLRDGYVDLSTHCITLFIDLIFSVDFRTTLPEFFTQKWYGEFAMKRMITTFEDYMSDYNSVIHPSLRDILVEELSDELLVHYLSAIRNRGAKFRRQDPFTDKFKDDVITIFGFFQKFPDAFSGGIKDRWRIVDFLVRLLEAEKGLGVVTVYEGFKTEYWDLQLSWVEAVLRSRDDFEKSMITAVKAKSAELYVERGAETIMGRVR